MYSTAKHSTKSSLAEKKKKKKTENQCRAQTHGKKHIKNCAFHIIMLRCDALRCSADDLRTNQKNNDETEIAEKK